MTNYGYGVWSGSVAFYLHFSWIRQPINHPVLSDNNTPFLIIDYLYFKLQKGSLLTTHACTNVAQNVSTLNWNIDQLWKFFSYFSGRILKISFWNYVSSLLSKHFTLFYFYRSIRFSQKFISRSKFQLWSRLW